MKILIYGLHFKPDLIGIGKYTGEMADWLHSSNYEVRVITAPHFYPEWKQLKRLWYYKKDGKDYKVWRCPIYVPKVPSGITRLIHSISFVISSLPILIRNLLWKPKFIISIEPPFLTAPLSYIYAKLTGAKAILHIQDLEIDAAYSLNILNKDYFYKLIKKIEYFTLRGFDIITTISPMMKNQIVEMGVDSNKIHLLPNWADIDSIHPDMNCDRMRKIFDIQQDQIIILYSGNIGEKQNLPIVLSAAKKMQNNKTMQFIIIGDGATKNKLIKKVNEEKISNVKFFPLQHTEDLGELLNLADIHLITQDNKISDLVLPSKMTNILSAGGVAIVSANKDTQLYQLINKYNIAYLINPNSENELIEAINYLITNSSRREKISLNARKYAEKYLSKQNILNEFEDSILKR